MANFDLKSAKIFQAVKWGKNPLFRFVNLWKNLSIILFLFFFFAGFLGENGSDKIFALSIFFLVFYFFFLLLEKFFSCKLKNPCRKLGSGEPVNLAEFLSFEAALAAAKSKNNSTVLFYNIIKSQPDFNFIFSRSLLNIKNIKKILKEYFKKIPPAPRESSDFPEIFAEALKIAESKNRRPVTIELGDVLAALARRDLFFKKILLDFNLKPDDIENLVYWLELLKKRIQERKRFWEWQNLIKVGSLARTWSAGYALTLEMFSSDITEVVKRQGFPDVIGHQKEVEAMERFLAKRERNNVLIVGEQGSGRKSMIQALAKRAALGQSFPEINYKRVVRLDLPSILAQTDSSQETEKILDKIFREVLSAGNIILVIDEFHDFIGQISGALSPYLALPKFQIVAITTFEGLHKKIEQNSSVLSLFEKVEVSEISDKETLLLLGNLSLFLERKYKVFISYPALREIINYSARYLPAQSFPEKATKLLDDVAIFAAQEGEKIILPKHVAEIVSAKTQIPVGEIEAKEKDVLLNLENLIHQRIINQEEAVGEVSSALRRARAEITVRKGTIGSFLFLGPTGVGKTETAKALAAIYFGSEEKMIRLDMSEFQNVSDISRLIGSVGEEGALTTQIRERPFSLVLLDEIEKAHPDILNLFLQVLDEGNLTDGLGRKVDFKNAIIIATSNAGYQVILESLKAASEWSNVKEKLLNFIFERGIFRPELINRFDGVVVFGPLSKENLLAVVELQLKKMKKGLAEKEIEFVVTESLKAKIVELGYDPTFGARQMQRVIQDKIGNVLAKAILSNQIKRGSKVEIDPETFQIK
ncbi:MAG: ATP-dependent Clp protease ATP-binding subunit [bacterium]